jgi:hypothetical protein
MGIDGSKYFPIRVTCMQECIRREISPQTTARFWESLVRFAVESPSGVAKPVMPFQEAGSLGGASSLMGWA